MIKVDVSHNRDFMPRSMTTKPRIWPNIDHPCKGVFIILWWNWFIQVTTYE